MLSEIEDLRELIQSGLFPQPKVWDTFNQYAYPWNLLIGENFIQIRNLGIEILPTIERLKNLLIFLIDIQSEAKTQSAQAWTQALFCFLIAPLFSMTLYHLIDELSLHIWTWVLISLISTLFTALGAFWIYQISIQAQWGRLPKEKRSWILSSSCAIERLLSQISSGATPDIAWEYMIRFLEKIDPPLAQSWGESIWADTPSTYATDTLQFDIQLAGQNFKKSLQICLLEGRPCMESLKTQNERLQKSIQNKIRASIKVLGLKTLKPLFLLAAPGIFILIGSAFWILIRENTF